MPQLVESSNQHNKEDEIKINSLQKLSAKNEEKSSYMEPMTERTKKKRRRHHENDLMKTDILQRTPKMEKSFSYVNLNHH